MTPELRGRTALVTGGAGNVGRVVVERLAGAGATVLVNCFHSYDEAKALVTGLRDRGLDAHVVRASVAKRDQVERMFAQIEREHGRLDILVNNAASGTFGPLDEVTDEALDRAFATNVKGALWCSLEARRLLVAAGGGAIVNVSSIGATHVPANYLPVGVSKAALEALTRYLSVELAPDHIRVNAASCGLIDNTVGRMFPRFDEVSARTVEATPLGRLATAEDLADVIVFLAAPQSRWVTGQTILADGGLSLASAPMSPPAQAPLSSMPPTPPTPPTPTTPPGPRAPSPEAPEPPGEDEANGHEAIAVVGMGIAVPGASSPEGFWTLLDKGAELFCEVPSDRWPVDGFHDTDRHAPDKTYQRRSGFITDFRPHPGSMASYPDGAGVDDDAARDYTMVWLRHALAQALDGVCREAADEFSFCVGYTPDGSQHLQEALTLNTVLAMLADEDAPPGERSRVAEALRRYFMRGRRNTAAFLPHRVGRDAMAGILPDDTRLHVIDTACSSSLYAIDMGIRDILSGRSDIAVCGGSFALAPSGSVLFSKLNGLSVAGEVKALDAGADGVLFSDGAGVVVLKRLSRARADGDAVLGVVSGVGLSADGRGKAIYAPSSTGQDLAVSRALDKVGIESSAVDWIIAHATGTPAGDAAEFTSLRDSYACSTPIQVTSNKSLIGHTGWAAGVASVIHALLALRHDTIPAQHRFSTPPRDFELDSTNLTIPTGPVPWHGDDARPRTAAISGFGFGGTNAHLIVQEHRPGLRPDAGYGERREDDLVVIGWSAHRPDTASSGEAVAESPAPPQSFGVRYPAPPFPKLRMPSPTVRATDRSQLMIVECMQRLEEPVARFCLDHKDRAGVVVGHMGPTRNALLYGVRAYLDEIERVAREASSRLDGFPDRLRRQLDELIASPSEDSFPGEMPNVIAARLSNYFDLRGLNMTVDNGEASLLEAFDVAEQYLRFGDLDVALVAGVNGNSLDAYATLLDEVAPGAATRGLAEAAFLFVVSTEAMARSAGLPVLGVLEGVTAEAEAGDPHPGEGPVFLGGAEGALELVSFLRDRESRERTRIRRPVRGSGRSYALDLRRHEAPVTQAPGEGAGEPDPPQETGGERGGETVPPAWLLDRHVVSLVPSPARPERKPLPLFDSDAVVVTNVPDLLAGAATDARVLIAVEGTRLRVQRPGGGAQLLDSEAAAELDAQLDAAVLDELGAPRHVRVIVGLPEGEPFRDGDDLAEILLAHEAAFLVARRWASDADAEASFVAVVLGGISGGAVPHPSAGLFTGFTKSLALEFPDARVLAVVHEARILAHAAADVVAETGNAQYLPVVYRSAVRRLTVAARREPGEASNEPVTGSSVVVAAGGGHGIGAELLKEVARRYRPRLYVLGSTDLDLCPPEVLTQDDEEFAAGKRDFILAQTAGPERVTVAAANVRFNRMASARRVHRNLDEMRRHCGVDRVTYIACDLRDARSVAETVARVREEQPVVDLLLNIAGTNRASAVGQKSLRDFHAVRDLKLSAYANLRRAFADAPPRRWCNFGSLVGLTGQRGETDYASANDFLTAAALHSAAQGTTEFTVGWTLWGEVGLGSSPVMRSFLEKSEQYSVMTNAEGVHHFLTELAQARHDPATVLFGAAERVAIEEIVPGYLSFCEGGPPSGGGEPRPNRPLPELYVDEIRDRTEAALTVDRTFDLDRDGYLRHHLVDGHPTLPGTFVPELAAQAAMRLVPDRVPVAFENLNLESFLRVYRADRPEPKRIEARLVASDAQMSAVDVRVLTDVVSPSGHVLVRDKVHFSVRVLLRDTPTRPPRWEHWPEFATDPLRDPYHLDNPAVLLSGVFVSTADTRLHALGRRARVHLDRAGIERWFSGLAVPSVLLDGLARVAVLKRLRGDWTPLAVPRTIARIDLYGGHTDASLARDGVPVELYSTPVEIDLEDPRQHNRSVAVAGDGEVVLQIKDMTGVVVGYLNQRTGRFLSKPDFARLAHGRPGAREFEGVPA